MSIYNKSGSVLSECYNKAGSSLNIAYDKLGNAVFSKSIGTQNYSNYTATSYKTISTNNTQGMDISNGVLFQFRGTSSMTVNNTVSLFDWASGSSIKSSMEIESGHANAVAFSNTLYDQNDEFPVIYCGDWFDPIVHVNRVSRSEATHLYDIIMSTSDTGYHPNPCIDFDNNILYMVGYTNTTTTSSTDNLIVVSKWDLSDMTDNGDGTFTPTKLGKYTRDFIYVLQDLKFNDGYIWMVTGMNNSTMYLRALNPDTGVLDYSLAMPITTEIEGLKWEFDDNTNLWFAYVGFMGGTYYKVTFTQ